VRRYLESDFNVAGDLQRLCENAGLAVVKTENTSSNLGVTPYTCLAALMREALQSKGNES
jgi:hypothetical protein